MPVRRMKRSIAVVTFAILSCNEIYCAARLTSIIPTGEAINKNRRNKASVDIQPRIVGGDPAADGKYPSYAIPDIGEEGGLCGATLIHGDILVSAAHCKGVFEGRNVIIGGNQLVGADAAEVIAVDREYVHPDFSVYTLQRDVMLIKLESPSEAPIVKYNGDSSVPNPGDAVTVIGFGATEEDGDPSYQLLEVNLQIVDFNSCYDAYWRPFFGSPIVDDIMICAGALDGAGIADSCQGDSGGPLFDSDGVLNGIVSFGAGCGRDGIPGVYTRVSEVADFIRSGICELSDSPPSSCSNKSNNNDTIQNGEDNDGIISNLDETDSPTDQSETESPTFVSTSVSDGTTDEITDEVTDEPTNEPTEDEPTNDEPTNDECKIECTWALVFTGVVLHLEDSSTGTCNEVCAFMFFETFISEGYQCGLCPQ